MSVPKGERKENKTLTALVEMQNLRKMISRLMTSNFGFKEDKYLEKIEEMKQKKYKNIDSAINKYNAFISWYIEDERKVLMDYLRSAEKELVMGNRIYIYTLTDYDERRYHLNECMGYLYALNNELQAVIDFLPVDINKYTQFGTKIDLLNSMVAGIRKNDNAVRQKIIKKKNHKKSDPTIEEHDPHVLPCVNKGKESIYKN